MILRILLGFHIFTLVVILGGGALSIGLGGSFGGTFGWVAGEILGNVLDWSKAGWKVDGALADDFIDFEGRPVLACGV